MGADPTKAKTTSAPSAFSAAGTPSATALATIGSRSKIMLRHMVSGWPPCQRFFSIKSTVHGWGLGDTRRTQDNWSTTPPKGQTLDKFGSGGGISSCQAQCRRKERKLRWMHQARLKTVASIPYPLRARGVGKADYALATNLRECIVCNIRTRVERLDCSADIQHLWRTRNRDQQPCRGVLLQNCCRSVVMHKLSSAMPGSGVGLKSRASKPRDMVRRWMALGASHRDGWKLEIGSGRWLENEFCRLTEVVIPWLHDVVPLRQNAMPKDCVFGLAGSPQE